MGKQGDMGEQDMGDGGRMNVGGRRTRKVLVTGGTGFVGSAAVRAMVSDEDTADRPEIRVLSRKALPGWMTDAGIVGVRGDLTDPESLQGSCDGVSTVLHLAAQVGGGREICEAVNVEGTRSMLRVAGRAGVRRVVHLSTTAVYGHGVHRGASESLLAPAPVSETSRTRLLAERQVRAVGGTVLRPHLVYGPGDTWFLPTVFRLLSRVPAWIERGDAVMSVVSVQDLGRVVAALSQLPWGPHPGAVFHVNQPEPVTYRELIGTVLACLGIDPPAADLPAAEVRERARRELPELSDHQFELLAVDHWYESSRIWRRAGVSPGPGLAIRLGSATEWYRGLAAHVGLVARPACAAA